jgi:hypothetical protein
LIGLSNGNISDNSRIVEMQHLYVYPKNYDYDSCFLSGNRHNFDWPNGIIKPTWNGKGDVVGCGLSLSPHNKLSIFFTGNGILMGQFICCCCCYSQQCLIFRKANSHRLSRKLPNSNHKNRGCQCQGKFWRQPG